jgi:hypothetical protein
VPPSRSEPGIIRIRGTDRKSFTGSSAWRTVAVFLENQVSIYGQFEEEAPLEDVEAQTPQAFEVEST